MKIIGILDIFWPDAFKTQKIAISRPEMILYFCKIPRTIRPSDANSDDQQLMFATLESWSGAALSCVISFALPQSPCLAQPREVEKSASAPPAEIQ